jgi:Zn-dependent M28 family amino/carboxypeptidase/Tol biopolymer transport system component
LLVLAACATTQPAGGPPPSAAPATPPAKLAPEEKHLKDLKQLSFGGENAEAYWSFDGTRLSLQAHKDGEQCDRIFTMRVFDDPPTPKPVSSGLGATTCSHFLPGDTEVIYASTHLASPQCPPRPDMSQGYVWALYDSYDIFRAQADGSNLRQLTHEKGYDAEGTVCARDGSIVFTSTRDGDIELYRMDADGKNVKRLTFEPGYDGGAFFNADCSKIVWRASRPKPGKELDDFRALLGKGLVRPTQLELYVMNADGSDQRQVTYLGSASFAPFWFPKQDRIIFASNYPDPRGREFDLWALNADGTGLERITYAKGFDGFPMFSPDGQWLAFSSNRATAEGRHDTNVFIARWVPGETPVDDPAQKIKTDVEWLADPAREGRGLGTKGLEAAGAYLEERFKALGLATERDPFQAVTALKVNPSTSLKIGKDVVKDVVPMGFSAQGKAKGALALAGWGIADGDFKDVKGKIAVVKRFTPPEVTDTVEQRKLGDLRHKAFLAREHGAVALLIYDDVEQNEAPLPSLQVEGTTGDAGIPVLVVKRAAMKNLKTTAELNVTLDAEKTEAFNVVATFKAQGATLPPLIIGAHYDHLGYGGRDSLAPGTHAVHPGADDNASGTATVLEIARALTQEPLKRDVIFIAFSGEEAGVLGSAHFVATHKDLLRIGAIMLNLDMVGRMRGNALDVLGTETADEWKGLVDAACARATVKCNESGDGYGPSDHTPFYTAGLPVLHFFTGAHSDYHKPSDTPEKLTYSGAARVAYVITELALALQDKTLTYKKLSATPRGDMRSFGASLGTVPDYGGPPNGIKGVLLQDVRPGGGADKGGLKRGDILIKLGTHAIGSVEDLMYVLQASKPGETVTAVVLREGKEVPLEVTFQEGRHH